MEPITIIIGTAFFGLLGGLFFFYMAMKHYKKQARADRMERYRAENRFTEIQTGLARLVEEYGGKWVEHGTDDKTLVCFEIQDTTIQLGRTHWGIDGIEVPFEQFLVQVVKGGGRWAKNRNRIGAV